MDPYSQGYPFSSVQVTAQQEEQGLLVTTLTQHWGSPSAGCPNLIKSLLTKQERAGGTESLGTCQGSLWKWGALDLTPGPPP